MSRATVIIRSKQDREKCARWIWQLPDLSRVSFQKPRRSLPQNDMMWSLLTIVSETIEWHGQRHSPEDWKDFFMHALKRARWMPDENGGFVPVGMRTSSLSKDEMSDLIELINEFVARQTFVPERNISL